MLDKFYKQFKSGTDIRGVASEGVEGQPVNLTDDVVARMADGFVLWLSKKVSKAPETLTISLTSVVTVLCRLPQAITRLTETV